MVNEYNHGRPKDDEGYGMDEYDMPPEPPPPEPIIPTALYYELPAGLMAPLVGVRNMHQLRSNVSGVFLFSCCKVRRYNSLLNLRHCTASFRQASWHRLWG